MDLDRFTLEELAELHRHIATSAERLYLAAKNEISAPALFHVLFAAADEQLELAQSITSHLWGRIDA